MQRPGVRRRTLAGLFCLATALGVDPAWAQASKPSPSEPAAGSSGALPPLAESPDSNRPAPNLRERLQAWVVGKTDAGGRTCEFFDAVATPLGAAIACGASGLWLVRDKQGDFELGETRDLGGQVVGFMVEGDRVWAKINRLEAVPIDSARGHFAEKPEARRAAPPTTPPPSPREAETPALPSAPPEVPSRPYPSPIEGEVVRMAEGRAIITLGSSHGVEPGANVEFLVEERLPVPGGAPALNRRPVAVGVVTRVSSEHAEVRLGINEQVPIGAVARLTKQRPTESRVAPPRLHGIWEVGAVLRPFLGLGELGGGILASGFASYHFESNFRVLCAIDPFGWADSDREQAATSFTGFVLGAFDTRLFELGFGGGGQTVNSVDSGLSTGSALLLVQTLRLGAYDGLQVAARSDVTLFHREFAFSGLTVIGQLPVGRGIWLTLRGAGSNAGYGEGELGIRTLLSGNGDRGSTFLRVAVGGAELYRDSSCAVQNGRCTRFVDRTNVSGPLGAFGMEWRF